RVEVRRSWLGLMAAYAVAGILTATAGGHVVVAGRDGIIATAAAFTVLAVTAALFHELGHALVGVAFGRRPVGLVLKAGAAVRIEEAPPGSRAATAPAESLVALSGPLASGLIGLAYLGVSTSSASPFAWAGLLALFDGLANLLPIAASSDGSRILHALRHQAWRRGRPLDAADPPVSA
ncbi:hypothetical protein ACH5WX_10630, partial [Nocardioides sp. CER28]